MKDLRKRSLNFHRHFVVPGEPDRDVAHGYMRHMRESRTISSLTLRDVMTRLEDPQWCSTVSESDIQRMVPVISSQFDNIPIDVYPGILSSVHLFARSDPRVRGIMDRIFSRMSTLPSARLFNPAQTAVDVAVVARTFPTRSARTVLR
jgi:hypothetical protein